MYSDFIVGEKNLCLVEVLIMKAFYEILSMENEGQLERGSVSNGVVWYCRGG